MKPIDKIKKLRQITGLSVIECKKALEEAGFDLEKAKLILKQKLSRLSENKTERATKEGIVEAYIHSNKKIGVLLEILCETDFVAKSKDFQTLSHEICLQIAAQNPFFLRPEDVKKKEGVDKKEVALLAQPWIRDETKTIDQLIKEHIAKFGENIVVRRFTRYQI